MSLEKEYFPNEKYFHTLNLPPLIDPPSFPLEGKPARRTFYVFWEFLSLEEKFFVRKSSGYFEESFSEAVTLPTFPALWTKMAPIQGIFANY